MINKISPNFAYEKVKTKIFNELSDTVSTKRLFIYFSLYYHSKKLYAIN